jgi:hypothetical protein
VQIPAFKKAVDNDHPTATPRDVKPLPALVVVQLNNSRFGLGLYLCSYAVFALSLLAVFYPFILAQPIWLLALAICWSGLWWIYRQQNKRGVTGLLGFGDNYWQLEEHGRTCQLELAGEVLCWSWLIVLPLREIANDSAGVSHNSSKIRQLVIFSDALSKEDNARLRRWLRACLIPRA